ncbi:hypothetical protein FO519_003502 [Halicephalobus sp. NKZ332]|nr:hypothetical protein FO519_003502 [Halicephalobus sp. NKZ332]
MSTQNLSIQSGFYEIGAYKSNIKRIKDGIDELEELSKMVKERADIESKYGKSLQQWNEKWMNHVDSKVPTGTIKDSWSKILEEGSELSKLHTGLKERFADEIIRTIALFKKENHHSRPFGGSSKEIHEISEAFEKAQKQWKKLFDKVESAKKQYFNASRNEKSAQVQMTNAQSDNSMSPDANEKLRDRVEKCKEEVRKAKNNYEIQLAEIDKYRNVYIENMGFVFEKCQQMELKRMKFSMEMIGAIENVMGDLVDAERLGNLHRDMKDRFKSVGEREFQADLKEWSRIHGVDAPVAWPNFEENDNTMYSKYSYNSTASNAEHKVLQNSNRNQIGSPFSDPFPMRTPETKGIQPIEAPNMTPKKPTSSNSSDSDSFERKECVDSNDNECDDEAKYGDFPGQIRGPARALYDYIPIEGDEMALRKGEILEVLAGPDSLGWCTGKKGNESGLFPASYVMPV